MKNLIILHGWQSSKERWQQVKEIIERQGINVIVPDLPGFKPENALPKPWNLDDYVDWFRKFPYPSGEIFLFGHSFGGRMAIKLGALFPERLSGLILCAAAGIKHKKTTSQSIFALAAGISHGFSFLPGFGLARRFFYRYFIRKTDYLKVDGFLKETFRSVIAEDLTPYLGRISLPTMILWGEKDQSTPLRDATLMKREIRNSILKVIPGKGHRLNLEAPEKVAQSVIEFIG